MYSMQVNPNAATMGFSQPTFGYPNQTMGYGGGFGNPNAFQFQNTQPVNQVALPASTYPNTQPLGSYNPVAYNFA